MLVQLQQFTFEFVLDVNLAVFLKIKDIWLFAGLFYFMCTTSMIFVMAFCNIATCWV